MLNIDSKELEYQNCSLCGDENFRFYRTINEWQLVSCRNCGLVQLRPRPSIALIAKMYEEEYFADRNIQYNHTEIEKQINAQTGWVINLNLALGHCGELLDVGCASGFLVAAANRLGWQGMGVDVSNWSTDFARNSLNINVVTGTIEDIKNHEFDAITMISSLEHQLDPMRTLKHANNLLKPNGILMVHLPNIAGFSRLRDGDNWYGWHLPFHFYHFSPKTLARVVRKAGFDIIRIERQVFLPRRIKKTDIYKVDFGGKDDKNNKNKELIVDNKRLINIRKIAKRLLGHVLSGRDMTLLARKPPDKIS